MNLELTDQTKAGSVDWGILVVIPAVPAVRRGDALVFDEKAVAGLALYSRYWPGRVLCIFRESRDDTIIFDTKCDPNALPFDVVTVPKGARIPDDLLRQAAIVLGAGDNQLDLPLAKQCKKLGIPIVFVIENTPETRRQIIQLSGLSVVRRVKRLIYEFKTEMARRRAFLVANGLQANGTSAARKYDRINANIVTFFDGRLSQSMFASRDDLAVKAARRATGAPLRLAFSGRLERLKGADHLLPIAKALVARGVNFRFDIFGPGSLSAPMRVAARSGGLADRFAVHDPLDFATGLVPWMRNQADLFICCHRQSDPSCTYLETLGCGVPIVGYRNGAFEGILSMADVGWLVDKDNPDAVADVIAVLDHQRDQIAARASSALAFASKHSFETTFFNRIAHLRSVACVRDQADRSM